jgi:hypothetical protein
MSGCVGRVCGCWGMCKKKKKQKLLEELGKDMAFEVEGQKAFGVVAPAVFQDWVLSSQQTKREKQ